MADLQVFYYPYPVAPIPPKAGVAGTTSYAAALVGDWNVDKNGNRTTIKTTTTVIPPTSTTKLANVLPADNQPLASAGTIKIASGSLVTSPIKLNVNQAVASAIQLGQTYGGYGSRGNITRDNASCAQSGPTDAKYDLGQTVELLDSTGAVASLPKGLQFVVGRGIYQGAGDRKSVV